MGPVAYVLGARIIEKHFTLDRASRGTDHSFSIEPVGLRKLVRDLKRTRISLGSPQKQKHECEVNPLVKMGKKLVAAHDLAVGTVLTANDVAIKSPADGGLPPYELDKVVGKKIKHALVTDDDILFEVLD